MAKGMREIKRQMKSIQNTKQITKAMEMIAAARLKRAQQLAIASKPYAVHMHDIVAALAQEPDVRHPLLEQRPIRTVGMIVISGDRGLAGGYHANTFRLLVASIRAQQEAGKNVELYVIGRKARDFVKRLQLPMVYEQTGIGDSPAFSDVQKCAAFAIDRYAQGAIDALSIVYNAFETVLSSRPTQKPMLPLNLGTSSVHAMRLYEPSVDRVLADVLPRYAETMVYAAVLDAKASEFAARMTAMSNATKNATKFIQTLTLQYNRARQASITQEITEIVAGANAQ
ncbi:MAG: ATP synthase F1 subunit gamma [Paenibacillaceae bacterium]|nr:ATP synthase F1 subunit gamma [Paenibacillaceae bacterium]